MSAKSKKVLVLDAEQCRDSRVGTYVPSDVAELMLLRLGAEKISQKVIRLLPRDSVILAASHFSPKPRPYIPAKLPSAEVEGVYFQEPADGPISSNVPRVLGLPRFREVYGLLGEDWRHPDRECPALAASV